VLAATAAIALVALPRLVISMLFGRAYLPASHAVMYLAVAALALSLVNIMVFYLLSVRSRWAGVAWVGVALAVLAVPALHDSATTIASVMLSIDLLVLVVIVGAVATTGRTRETHVRPDEALWRPGGAELDLTLVVPVFDPTPRMQANLGRLMSVLDELPITYEIVAISDAAATSGLELDDLPSRQFRVAEMERNTGKGAALRAGLATGRGRYLGFIDVGGDLDPELLTPFLSLVDLYQPDIVLGSKRHPLSIVEYPVVRRIYSVGYQILINFLFRLNIRDTQTGLKLVRREVLAAVLPRMVEKRFVFDLELFVVARRLGYRRFLEAPVHISEPFRRTVPLPAVSGMLLDTIAVFYRLRILRFYDRPVGWSPSDLPGGSLPETADIVLTVGSQ
jgi:hypothetical protein